MPSGLPPAMADQRIAAAAAAEAVTNQVLDVTRQFGRFDSSSPVFKPNGELACGDVPI